MDPYSVASAAALLLTLTTHIAGVLYRDLEDSSSTPAKRLIWELARIRAILQVLEDTSLSLNSPVYLGDLPDRLSEVRQVLLSIGAEVLEYNLRVKNLTVSKDPWVWWRFRTRHYVKKLDLSSRNAEKKVKALQDSILNLRESLANIPDLQPNTPVRKGISPPTINALWRDKADYSTTHTTSKSKRIEGTGLWLVRHSTFRDWIFGEKGLRTLHCVGEPGSGKTILASLVIDDIETLRTKPDTPNTGLAYFYFNYKASTPIRNVALALLEQFHLQSSTLATEIKDLEQRAIASKSITLIEIMAALSSVARRFRKAYIVIDALDRCPG